MKKALFISLCALLLAGTGCKKNAEPEPHKVIVTSVSVKPSSLSLKVGETAQLTATVTPVNADNDNVNWSSSDNSVATVADGLVTAVKEGSATITVTTVDGGKTATCAVTVSTDIVPVTGITIDQGATAEVEEGKTITLTATVQPDNATDKTVTWVSAHESIATVVDGVVTGIAPGQAIISAKAGDKTATCTVTVTRAAVAYEAVDLGLSVKWGNKNVGAEFPEDPGDYFAWGETAVKDNYTLENYVFGPDLTQASKYFGSGRTVLEEADDAARVNLGEGWRMPTQDEWDELIHQCTAQWTTQNDKTGVLVTAQSGASIFLPAAGVCNDYGNPWSLGAQGFYWSSSPVSEKYGLDWLTVVATHIFDPGVAEYGVIESVYGSLYEGYSVRPVFAEYVHVTGVSLNKDTETLAPDETLQLTATVSPENALEKAVKWTSSDETVATVTKGLVTAKGTGTATITVTTLDGEKTATCQISVEVPHASGVWLDKKAATRYLNGVVELKAHVVPSTAGDKSVSWSSSNEGVATVDANGHVTVLAEGEAIITATTVDGGLTDQCKLTVNPIPSGAVFSADTFNSSTDEEPLLILQQDLSNSTVYIRKSSGTVDFNGHTVKYLYMQNNDPDKVVGLCNGIISGRLDGDAGWYRYTGQTFHGKVMMEDMEVYKEFYTDGHVYTLNSGYYETVCTFRVGDALGDVYIYGGSFGKLFDVNPDAGSSQGDIFLFGGKFAIDPRTYTNAGTTNPRGNTRFIVGEGYSVKDNTEEDKDEFPYIVSKD